MWIAWPWASSKTCDLAADARARAAPGASTASCTRWCMGAPFTTLPVTRRAASAGAAAASATSRVTIRTRGIRTEQLWGRPLILATGLAIRCTGRVNPDRRNGGSMSENLARILTETAAREGGRTAVKLDDFEANYELLDQGSARVAGMLREKGLEPGDRVGLMLPNVPHFPLVYYGVLRAGGVVVPMNVLLKGREVKFYLEDPGAKLLFAWEGFADAAQQGAEEAGAECIVVEGEGFLKQVMEAEASPELVDRSGDDTAVILY